MIMNTIWTLLGVFLVFIMQAGFAMVETGLTRKKNAGNIMMKNLMDFAAGSVAYWAVGFAFMFGTGNDFIGTSGWFILDPKAFSSLDLANVPLMTKWLFQVVFAATAATIVSGAMAERTKFSSYMIYSVFISAIVYPVVGHWIWGGGWLSKLGFLDFAGSRVVHCVGAWSALAGVLVLGPRIGKYQKDGTPNPIPGHSMPLAILGVFLLWFGWFGFNPGSTMAAVASIGDIAVTTNLAAAAGAIVAMLLSWKLQGKPDVGMAGNGALAGLVAITAPCAFVENWAALVIGLLVGLLVVLSVFFWERHVVDDPVCAISVHGICGAFGTLAVGLFASPRLIEAAGVGTAGLFYGAGFHQVGIQALGVLATFAWVFPLMLLFFFIIKKTVGLRVSREEELAGLDIHEHGMWGYPEEFIGDTASATALGMVAPASAPKHVSVRTVKGEA